MDGSRKALGCLCAQGWNSGEGTELPGSWQRSSWGGRGRGLHVAGGPPAGASHATQMGAAQGQAAWGHPFLSLGCFVIATGP